MNILDNTHYTMAAADEITAFQAYAAARELGEIVLNSDERDVWADILECVGGGGEDGETLTGAFNDIAYGDAALPNELSPSIVKHITDLVQHFRDAQYRPVSANSFLRIAFCIGRIVSFCKEIDQEGLVPMLCAVDASLSYTEHRNFVTADQATELDRLITWQHVRELYILYDRVRTSYDSDNADDSDYQRPRNHYDGYSDSDSDIDD